jgi:hypothetical protein
MWTRSGYGDLGLALAKSLLRYDKFDLIMVPTKWGGCSRKYLSDDLIDSTEKQLFERIIKQPLNKQPEIFMQCSIPSEFQTPAKYNIGITAGIETTLARQDWIDGLNRMNLNLVTSNHAKSVFENAVYKVKNPQTQQETILKSLKPIEVLFWGTDTSIYRKTDDISPSIETELKNIPEDYCFLFTGQWTNQNIFGDRKDIGNLIRVFLETFSGFGIKPRPALILKTSGAALCNMDRHDIIARIKSVREYVKSNKKLTDLPNVYLMYGDLAESEMNSLYNHPKVKAMINFTHGEGFGAPLLEFSMTGKPIAVSNWSGHLDFLDSKLCKLLDGEVAPLPPESVNEWLIKDSAWFTVNYLKAAELMKNMFYHYPGYLEKSKQLMEKNQEMFSTLAMDKVFHEMLDKYIPKFATETKLILPKLRKIELPKRMNSQISESSPLIPKPATGSNA